jgi:hypothetical protein
LKLLISSFSKWNCIIRYVNYSNKEHWHVDKRRIAYSDLYWRYSQFEFRSGCHYHWDFPWLSSVLQANAGVASQLGHDRFHRHPCLFICHRMIWRCVVSIMIASLNKQ